MTLKNLFLMLMLAFLLVPLGRAEANSVVSERTEVTLLSDTNTIHAGQKFIAALHIKMQPGWHTYWKNPGDSGMTPDFIWTLPKGFVAGEIQYPAPVRLPVADMVDYGYNDDVWLPVTITAPQIMHANTITIVVLKARWLVCKDVCIPEAGEFTLTLPETASMEPDASPDALVIAEAMKQLPSVVPEAITYYEKDGKVHFGFSSSDVAVGLVKEAEFFPTNENFIVNNAVQAVEITKNKVSFAIESVTEKLPERMQGLIALKLNDGSRKSFAVVLAHGAAPVAVKMNRDFGQALLFAFLGGLILNLMPCVFPILSLKALAVARKAQKHKDQVRIHGLAYTAGVVVSFLALAGVLVTIQASGKAIGWGYQMQSPVFVFILAIVFFIVGLNLSGFFELPGVLGNFGGETAAKDSIVGTFVTGVLAVMVATPCTAPFMATAIGFAFTQPVPVIAGIFTCIGFGLAFPFLLFSIFPGLAGKLPRAGRWMLTFKQATAFPMYLCTVWLLWVLSHEAGRDAVFIALLIFVFITFSLWLGKLEARFSTLLGLIAGICTVLMVIGFVRFTTQAHKHALEREKFSLVHLKELQDQGQAVFVDATADWCITCKVNESIALSSRRIHDVFAAKHIVYMVADWTNGDKDITAYLQSFGRAGVPIYVYYPPGGKEPVILPQVLTESIVIEAIK